MKKELLLSCQSPRASGKASQVLCFTGVSTGTSRNRIGSC